VSSHDEASIRDQAIEAVQGYAYYVVGLEVDQAKSVARRAVNALTVAGLLPERDEESIDRTRLLERHIDNVLSPGRDRGHEPFLPSGALGDSGCCGGRVCGVVAGREQASRDARGGVSSA
jgi:hypothetical protein